MRTQVAIDLASADALFGARLVLRQEMQEMRSTTAVPRGSRCSSSPGALRAGWRDQAAELVAKSADATGTRYC
ncbi:MAG TPA: hypothetical protein VLC08_14260 [Chitinolyticbacter sp.]|nr:hypothetical protein [Chitinolyticbacter sp.]